MALRRLKEVFTVTIFLASLCILTGYFFLSPFSSTNVAQRASSNQSTCTLPFRDPFEPTVYHAFLKTLQNTTFSDCEKITPLLFEPDLESRNLVRKNRPEDYGITGCYYKAFTRRPGDDFNVTSTGETYWLTEGITPLPEEHEYIGIYCKRPENWLVSLVDAHALVKLNKVTPDTSSGGGWDFQTRPNVVVLMLDSVSHSSFIRTMPKSHAYLKDLDAFELMQYYKVGENTLPNMFPFLTGQAHWDSEARGCMASVESYYDNCTLLWKDFKARGYVTSYEDDSDHFSTFNYNDRGFHSSPTDFYPRPIMILMNHEGLPTKECEGPRNRGLFLLNQMKRVAVGANWVKYRPYFQFTVFNFAHENNVHNVQYDQDLAEFLHWFKDQGFLNKTLLLVMSDHGARWGREFNTPQGYLESRMPSAYFVLPHWFRQQYPLAVANLGQNLHRMTTAFDLHETMKDFLDLKGNLNNPKILDRTTALQNLPSSPRGISLFLPLPTSRTCQMAGIPGSFCPCNFDSRKRLDPNSPSIVDAIIISFNYIQNELRNVGNLCVQVRFKRVSSAWLRDGGDGQEYMDLMFETGSGALFQATLSRDFNVNVNYTNNRKITEPGWTLVGSVRRVSEIGSEADCVASRVLRNFCSCKV